ncbi:expressed unknown protein [Seminavis robusta]|uniref:Uncharacterized protein n=1 Tax=Seminavis robusta TaxID=568900 RepID=A0A9N8H7M1_9STRA|nr:expressed unknown protein [Seminavis robusta]|eukprot:Sro133_g063000.1 n/a (349) ;mRNA; r:45416-46462
MQQSPSEKPPEGTTDEQATTKAAPKPRKVHHMSVCMVPPPSNKHVWKAVSQMRRQLNDPGYYRWPHHANLLYPFLDVGGKDDDAQKFKDLVEQLHTATKQVEPFNVILKELGTFGGKQRGVLWLNPESSPLTTTQSEEGTEAPLLTLHKHLEDAFPICKDQPRPVFTPHMTISHYANLDDALVAKKQIEQNYPQLADGSLTFTVDRIYLIRREGDGGQFLRLADIGLGAAKNSKVELFEAGERFPDMPLTEEEWVREEKTKLKERRNGGRSRGGRRKQQRRRKSPRAPDSPEVIAAKRAERKAKREKLELEQRHQQMYRTLGALVPVFLGLLVTAFTLTKQVGSDGYA